MTGRLADRVAVVSGGGAGIGEATCHRLAEAGADVAAVDWHGDDAEETAAAIEAETDRRAIGIEADVGDPDDVARMAATVEETFGTVHVLVNNAAIRVDPKPVTEADEESWDRILDVNLRGVARCAKHVVPLMAEGGSVVNMASVGASVGRPGWSQYDATKGGIVAMTKDMACDHADDGIRVNAISPGWVITDYHLGDRSGDEAERYVEEKTTRGGADSGIQRRAGKPREIADAVLFLASDEASFVTGIDLPVDGGSSVVGGLE